MKIFKDSTNVESAELAIKHIISIAGHPTYNDETVDILMKILEKLVVSANVGAR